MYMKLQDTHSWVETEFARRNVIGSTPQAGSPLRPLRVCLSPNRWKREPLKIKVDPGLREFLHTSHYTLCALANSQAGPFPHPIRPKFVSLPLQQVKPPR